jgi:hypothetical protein
MKTVLALFYLFLSANIVLAPMLFLPILGVQLPWTPIGESERLTHQLTPEKIQLGSAPSAQAAPASAPVAIGTGDSTPSPTASGTIPAPPLAASSPAPVVATNTNTCVTLRKLTQGDTQKLNDQVSQQTGLSLNISDVSPNSFWVYIPPNGGIDGANRRAETLNKIGIEDYSIVRDPGSNQFAISLGLFHNEDAANRLLDTVHKKNIKSARIAIRDNTGTNARAELKGPATSVEALLKDFLGQHKDVQRDTCSTA